MAKKLIDVQANGFKSYVDATATAVGAEPALGDPGPGAWYLRVIDNVRSWVAQIPWAGVDKTGAVAADVGALPEIVVTGAANFNSINGGLPCAALVDGSSYTNAPIPSGQIVSAGGCSLIQLAGEAGSITQLVETMADGSYFRSYVSGSWSAWKAMWDSATLPAGTTGKALLATATQAGARSAISALPVANPTATGTLTAPDVVVSNLAGGVRFVVTDAAGKLVATYAPPSLPYLPTSGGIVSGDVAIDGLLRSQHSYPIPSGAFTLTDSFPNNSAFTVSGAATCDLDGTLSPGIEFTIATLASAITLQFSTVTCYLNGALVPTGTVLPQGRMYKMQLFNGTVWFING